MRQNAHAEAERSYSEALLLYRFIGDLRGEATSLEDLGDLEMARDEPAKARPRYEEAIQVYFKLPNFEKMGHLHVILASIAATNTEERKRHVQGAYAAWSTLGRRELIDALIQLFGPVSQ